MEFVERKESSVNARKGLLTLIVIGEGVSSLRLIIGGVPDLLQLEPITCGCLRGWIRSLIDSILEESVRSWAKVIGPWLRIRIGLIILNFFCWTRAQICWFSWPILSLVARLLQGTSKVGRSRVAIKTSIVLIVSPFHIVVASSGFIFGSRYCTLCLLKLLYVVIHGLNCDLASIFLIKNLEHGLVLERIND